MPITQQEILKYAFAQDGDKTEIPLDRSPKGEVSFQEGYPIDYSRNPEADGKYIYRDQFNYTQNIQSQGLKDLQVNGGRLWNQQSSNLIGGYPMGARVMLYYDLTTNEITDTPKHTAEGIALSTTLICVSMKENNLDSPLVAENLFKSWWIDDGIGLFGLKIVSQNPTANFYKVPSGYLDLGDSGVETKKYTYNDYPRVKYFKDNGDALPTYFKDNGDNTFSLVDLRGRFFRMFSNGGEIDSAREYHTLQGDATRNVTGVIVTPSPSNAGIFHSNELRGAFNSTGKNGRYYSVSSGGSADVTNICNFNNNNVVPTANENRPSNFNVKIYIKV